MVFKSDLFHNTFKVLQNLTRPYHLDLIFQSDWLPHQAPMNTQNTPSPTLLHCLTYILWVLVWNVLFLQMGEHASPKYSGSIFIPASQMKKLSL
jgi:hypothetical protein